MAAHPPDELEQLIVQLELSQQVGEGLRAYRAAKDAQRQFDAQLLNGRIDSILIQCGLNPIEYTIVQRDGKCFPVRVVGGRRPVGDLRHHPVGNAVHPSQQSD